VNKKFSRTHGTDRKSEKSKAVTQNAPKETAKSRRTAPTLEEQLIAKHNRRSDLLVELDAVNADIDRLEAAVEGKTCSGPSVLPGDTPVLGVRVTFLLEMLARLFHSIAYFEAQKGSKCIVEAFCSPDSADKFLRLVHVGGSHSFMRYLTVRYMQLLGFAPGTLMHIGSGAFLYGNLLCSKVDSETTCPPRQLLNQCIYCTCLAGASWSVLLWCRACCAKSVNFLTMTAKNVAQGGRSGWTHTERI
jgi:hypothetical protein